MKKNLFLVLIMFISLASLSSTSLAAPIAVINISGELSGIDGIELMNATWNVRFVEGSFNSIFGDSSALDFHTSTDAQNATLSLFEAFNLPQFLLYDLDPSRTAGISHPRQADILVPYHVAPTTVFSMHFSNHPDHLSPDFFGGTTILSNSYDTGAAAHQVYADWHMTSPVPIPAAAWFMSSGLLGLLGFSGKRSRAVNHRSQAA